MQSWIRAIGHNYRDEERFDAEECYEFRKLSSLELANSVETHWYMKVSIWKWARPRVKLLGMTMEPNRLSSNVLNESMYPRSHSFYD